MSKGVGAKQTNLGAIHVVPVHTASRAAPQLPLDVGEGVRPQSGVNQGEHQ